MLCPKSAEAIPLGTLRQFTNLVAIQTVTCTLTHLYVCIHCACAIKNDLEQSKAGDRTKIV